MANDVSYFKVQGDATQYSFNDADLETKVDEISGKLDGAVVSASNTVAGLTIQLSYLKSAPNVMRLKITGSTTGELSTSSGYANLWNANTFLTAAVGARAANIIKYIVLGAYKIQINIEAGGLIKIGYTSRLSDNVASNIPSGTPVYVNEVLFIA